MKGLDEGGKNAYDWFWKNGKTKSTNSLVAACI